MPPKDKGKKKATRRATPEKAAELFVRTGLSPRDISRAVKATSDERQKAMAEAGRLFRSRGRQPGTLKRVPPQAAKKKK